MLVDAVGLELLHVQWLWLEDAACRVEGLHVAYAAPSFRGIEPAALRLFVDPVAQPGRDLFQLLRTLRTRVLRAELVGSHIQRNLCSGLPLHGRVDHDWSVHLHLVVHSDLSLQLFLLHQVQHGLVRQLLHFPLLYRNGLVIIGLRYRDGGLDWRDGLHVARGYEWLVQIV